MLTPISLWLSRGTGLRVRCLGPRPRRPLRQRQEEYFVHDRGLGRAHLISTVPRLAFIRRNGVISRCWCSEHPCLLPRGETVPRLWITRLPVRRFPFLPLRSLPCGCEGAHGDNLRVSTGNSWANLPTAWEFRVHTAGSISSALKMTSSGGSSLSITSR